MVEFADIGARDEMPAGTVNDDRAYDGVRLRRLDGREQGRAHRLGERIHRRMVDHDHGDLVAAPEGGFLHAALDQTRSSTMAMPCPTPMHMVHKARRPPPRSSWRSAVAASRAPLAPSG
jgi:hypothetical protein